jgi:hypothetical protein
MSCGERRVEELTDDPSTNATRGIIGQGAGTGRVVSREGRGP